VNGKAQRSCLLPVRQASGKSITTIEGLGTPEKPDPIEAAFISEAAAQCGYCTSGMIMSAKSLLTQTPRATREQIKQGMAGNLCRCGTHTRILRAIEKAGQGRIA
jgi:nicotinate dehydrogenase subunit A